MKISGILLIIVLAIGVIPVQYYIGSSVPVGTVPQAHAQVASHPNLFVSAENSQYNNYFAGPQVVQVVVSDPNINRLDLHYGEPVVTVNGKRLRMAQATDGNWYGYFADRNQAISASNTAPLPGKGLNFGAFCSTGTIGGIDWGSQTKGFTVAEGGFSGAIGLSYTGSKIPAGPLGNACSGTGNGVVFEHVIRENKTLNTNPSGYAAPLALVGAWPVIQLYDFSAVPTPVTVDYQAAGGDQIVSLTFDKIPAGFISLAPNKTSYPNNAPVYLTLNDSQLDIDPTEEDSWTWGANANNNTLFYQAFNRNGNLDADGYCAKNAVSTIPVGITPLGIAYDSAKGEIFVANGNSDTVSVISDATNSVIATITVGSHPVAISYDSAKGEIFVANSFVPGPFHNGTVSVISDATNSVIATITVDFDPVAIAYDSAKGEIFVANISSSTISVISDATNNVVATIVVNAPAGISYDSAMGEIFVTSSGSNSVAVIRDTTNNVVATIPVGSNPTGIAYDSVIGEIFVANNGDDTVSVINDAKNSVVGTIPVGSAPFGIEFDSGMDAVFVANSDDNTVSIIGDAKNSVVGTIPVGSAPRAIAYDSVKSEIFVTNISSGTVSFFNDIATSAYIHTACNISGAIPAMQNLSGNLTAFMFNQNGKLTINPFSNSVRIIDFESNGKQILNGSSTTRGDPTKQRTLSISSGSEPITFIEQGGVNTGAFGNWDGAKKSSVVIASNLNFRGMQATFSYNGVSGGIVSQPDNYTILFKSGGFQPPANTYTISSIQMGFQPLQKVHFLIQFTNIPSPAEIAQLASQGIIVTDYMTGNTYIAYSNSSSLSTFTPTQNVRWIGQFLPSFKISPTLATNDTSKIPLWALVKSPLKGLPTKAVLTVELNRDADMNSTAKNLAINGTTIERKVPLIQTITVLVPIANLKSTVQYIAQLDDVQFIDAVDAPLVEQDDRSRASANADFVQTQEPLKNGSTGLLGDGVNVLLYDGGTVWPHPDFDNRLTDEAGSCNETHSTHVAGLLGGSGAASSLMNHGPPCIGGSDPGTGVCLPGSYKQWTGIAPHVNIDSVGYDKVSSPAACNAGPPSSDYNDENNFVNDYGLISTKSSDLASMSIASAVSPVNSVGGGTAGPLSYCCLGNYTLTSRVIDQIATGLIAKQNLIIFEAGGNYRVSPFGNYTTIDAPATAKDSIAIGAIDAKDYSILDTSGFGPTLDGRIKPDLTAPGCYNTAGGSLGYMFATSWWGPDQANGGFPTYDSACGTSEATPVAAGVASLLIEKWNDLHSGSNAMLPSTMKAILVHTAIDLGNPGPDYKFGWGEINAKAAVELVDQDAAQTSNHLINTDKINQGKEISFNFVSTSSEDVKATLVWDDPPTLGTSNGIVNQLDLTLIDPHGNRIQPYLLNPSKPNDTATRGVDSINNVKEAVGNGTAGTWQAVVDGTLVSKGPQSFTLIISNVLKRTTSTLISPSSVSSPGTVTVTATVSDNDTGMPLPVNGSVVFDDGNNGGKFTAPTCTHQNNDLVCTAEYTPNTSNTVSINAYYSGDQVHAKNQNYGSSTACIVAVQPFVSSAQSFTKIPDVVANFFSCNLITILNQNTNNSHLTNYVTVQSVPDKYAASQGIMGQNVTTLAFEDRYNRPESNNNLNVFLQISHTNTKINSMRGVELGGDQIMVGLTGTGTSTALVNSAEIPIRQGTPVTVPQKIRDTLNATLEPSQTPKPVLDFLNNNIDLVNKATGDHLSHYFLLQTVKDMYAQKILGIAGQNVTTLAFEDRYNRPESNGNLNVFLQISHNSTYVNSLRGVELGSDDIDIIVNGVDTGTISKSVEIPLH